MVFSSPTFLFLFLPLVLALHFAAPPRARNSVLLVASLLFFFWGEPFYTALILLSIGANWSFGLWVEHARAKGRTGRLPVATSVVFNLALLAAFKYADFLTESLSAALIALGASDQPLPRPGVLLASSELLRESMLTDGGAIRLPIGISFFTFQAMSYVIDVDRGETAAQRSPSRFALFIAFFPQLIAGPIVRYRDVAAQIASRTIDQALFASGVRRFVVGLAKKVLVADVVAKTADQVFALPADQLTGALAWTGVLCYAIQLYFDFSGYSDMAIGLARMFGFRFQENFDYPYVSRSITEFWRRWHISLSTWFRDYVYVPMGGNRRGRARTYFNLLIVFAACGLWHGAGATFVLFGLFHGAFLVIERLGFGRVLERLPRPARHAYALLVVLASWVIFRAASVEAAFDYLAAMFGAAPWTGPRTVAMHLGALAATAFVAGVIGSVPWPRRWSNDRSARVEWASAGATVALALLSAAQVAGSSYSPFIYFRF